MYRCFVCKSPTEYNAMADVSEEKFDKLVDKYCLIHCIGDEDQFDESGACVLCAKCVSFELIEAVRKWSIDNYNLGGDVIVEAYTDEEIQALLDKNDVTNTAEAIQVVRIFCGAHEPAKASPYVKFKDTDIQGNETGRWRAATVLETIDGQLDLHRILFDTGYSGVDSLKRYEPCTEEEAKRLLAEEKTHELLEWRSYYCKTNKLPEQGCKKNSPDACKSCKAYDQDSRLVDKDY